MEDLGKTAVLPGGDGRIGEIYGTGEYGRIGVERVKNIKVKGLLLPEEGILNNLNGNALPKNDCNLGNVPNLTLCAKHIYL